jgi:hypothetical protein
MPLYRFRLEAQDGSGHFRSGQTEAGSEDEARVQLGLREYRFAAYKLDPDREAILLEEYDVGSLEDLPHPAPVEASEEEKAEYRGLKGQHRTWLVMHRQAAPYELVELEEVG